MLRRWSILKAQSHILGSMHSIGGNSACGFLELRDFGALKDMTYWKNYFICQRREYEEVTITTTTTTTIKESACDVAVWRMMIHFYLT